MELKKTQCRFCDKKIIWGLRDGKRIPLDPTPAIYEFVGTDRGAAVVKLLPKDKYFVSHFATCTGVKKAVSERDKRRKDSNESNI